MKDITSSFEKLIGFIYHTFFTLIPAIFFMLTTYFVLKFYSPVNSSEISSLLSANFPFPIWAAILIIAFILSKIFKAAGIFINYYVYNFQVHTERIISKNRLYNTFKKKIEYELTSDQVMSHGLTMEEVTLEEKKMLGIDEQKKVILLNKDLYHLINFDMVSRQHQYHLLYEMELGEEYIYTSITIVLQMVALILFPVISGAGFIANKGGGALLYSVEIICTLLTGWLVQKSLLYKIKNQQYIGEENPVKSRLHPRLLKSDFFVIFFSAILLTSVLLIHLSQFYKGEWSSLLLLLSLNFLTLPVITIMHIKSFSSYLYVESLFIDLLIQRRYRTEITKDKEADFENKLKVDIINKQSKS